MNAESGGPAALHPIEPFPVVLAGPSGSGKTTIARALLERRPDLSFSVSVTSRPPREGERDGVDYRFMPRSDFERLIAEGGLLEWAEVHGELYGTARSSLDDAVRAGVHLLLDIDVQGARSVRRLVPGAVTIFLLPPTGRDIIARLKGRGTEDSAALRRRLRTAEKELAGVGEFDYAVVNDDLDACVAAVEGIIASERLRIDHRRAATEKEAAGMLEEIRRVLSEEGSKA